MLPSDIVQLLAAQGEEKYFCLILMMRRLKRSGFEKRKSAEAWGMKLLF
ncbi:hypothetical protein OIU84_029991 [Salix udensis]|uniref:Uncharacterized protein n=1 Tax=Salix udensis TaxID=889485 RepID=A0AAD6KAI0_9ROSI|nr:hypothetical protein OIU84_029991 [Salix udensis]